VCNYFPAFAKETLVVKEKRAEKSIFFPQNFLIMLYYYMKLYPVNIQIDIPPKALQI